MRCLVIVALLCVAAVAARAPPSSAGSASLSGSLQPAKSSASTSGSLSGSEASAASTSASNAVPNIPLPVPSSSSSSSSSDEHSESPLPANVDTSQALAAHKALLQAAAQAKQGKGLGANNRKVTVIGNVNIMNHNEEAADKPDYNKLAADQLASAQEARVKLAEASQKARESEEERKSNVPPAVPAPPPSPSPPPAPKEESEPAPAAPADTEEDLKARINDGKPFATKKEKVDNVIAEASKVPFAGQFKGAYSWTAWIKFTGPASTEPLLGLVHGGLDTQQNPAFFMQGTRFNKEGTLKIVSGTHACDTEWKPVFPRDKWFFVAVTHDADYFKVFHSLGDGVLHKPDESGCPTKPKAAPVEIKNAAVLAAGAKFSAKPAPMEWSDVRRYVRSLSDEEIEKIMKQARHP